MTNFRRLKALSPGERKTLLAALCLLPATGLLVRLAGVRLARRTLRGLGRWRVPRVRAESEWTKEANRVATMVNIAARRGIYRANCLARSLVLEALLLRRGIDCELKFGARVVSGPFTAHAWVECGGTPVGDAGRRDRSVKVLA